jgi:hypothetical protein
MSTTESIAAPLTSVPASLWQNVVDGSPAARLRSQLEALGARYAAAKPYPHLVIDDLFDPGVLDRIVAEFPKAEERDWIVYDTVHEIKQTSRGLSGLSPFTQLFFLQLCSEPFVQVIRDITGFSDLLPDPLFQGGGLHESFRGGWLNIHADWTKHPALPLTRRLNLIVYLNRDWQPSWGGDLELCDPDTKTCMARVAPVFNRTALFPTTNKTFHGFPTPITCPTNRSRKSVSVYYWSPDPEALKEAEYITFLPGRKRTRLRAFLRSLTPPIAFAARDALIKALRGY